LIVPIHAANPGPMTGAGNWTYLLPGRDPLLIDAGTGETAHLDAIAAVRVEGPGHVVVTHAHGDHASGTPALRTRWPQTTFAKYPWPGRDDRYPADWTSLADGDVLAAGDGQLIVVHTPGHAPDHIALWDPDSRTLFSGDLVTVGTTVVILASTGGRLSQYLASLRRVLALQPARLLPAHGPPIDDPAAVIGKYLEHRGERELQVIDSLREGLRSIDAIVARIYRGLTPALVPMAKESVLAHLVKLEEEGRARREGDEWME
jgi:glyoxylase-like metal-dependent hydrolase (beta-lactamase superfamily II)